MNENEEVEFIINCKMKRSWMNTFCSFLKMMENFGHDGMSRDFIFYCDGDGDFRPKFDLPEYRTKQAKQYRAIINGERSDTYFFDVENKYIEDNESSILLKNNNIFAQQWWETEKEFKERQQDIFITLFAGKKLNKDEYDEMLNKYLEDMKQKEKERKEYFQDMKNLLDKNR